MASQLTQAEARQHKLQAQRGNMRSLGIILEHLLGGDITLDNLTVTALTIDGITGGDSSLGIDGEAAAQGGAIVITGGTSSTAGNVGGVMTLVGGTPGSTSAGGAFSATAGAGGSTSGAGGAASLVGGAATAGNSVGGEAFMDGGAGQGTSAGGACNVTSGASEDGTAVNPGASGAVIVESGSAGTATTGTAGASGALTVQSAAGGAATSDNATGGASGDLSIVTGDGGAITVGNGTGGASGNILITSGDGGADTEAADGTGGIAGDVIITAGTGGAGNTVGKSGAIYLRPGGTSATPLLPLMRTMAIPSGDASGAATLTFAEMFGGVHVNNPGGAAAITTPTGQAITDAIGLVADGGSLVVGDSFDFTLMNTGSTGQIQTLTAGDGNVTFIGNVTVDPGVAAEGGGSGTWRFRYTSADAWVGYRIG